MTELKAARTYIQDMKDNLDKIDLSALSTIVDVLISAKESKRRIFIMGNGGSACVASHFSCDLGKGTVKNLDDEKEDRFKTVSLTENVAVMTAHSNDLAYEHVFSQQLRNLAEEGDVVVAISSSGNSPNILAGIKEAKSKKAITIGFVGFDGGKLKKMVDHVIHIPKNDYGVVEDIHSCLQHMLCYTISERLG